MIERDCLREQLYPDDLDCSKCEACWQNIICKQHTSLSNLYQTQPPIRQSIYGNISPTMRQCHCCPATVFQASCRAPFLFLTFQTTSLLLNAPCKVWLDFTGWERAETLPWPKNISGTQTLPQPLELLAHNPRIYCLYSQAKPVRSVTEPNSSTICPKLTTAIEIMVFLCSSSTDFVFKLMRHPIHTLTAIIMAFWSRPGQSCCW